MRLAVLGSHVASSLSPVMHRAALLHHGIPGTYEAHPVDDRGFAEAVADLRSGRLDGANVTMPHKHVAFSASDERSSNAVAAGAVNTLSRRGDQLVGDNTDIGGLAAVWRERGLPEGVPVTVLGAGGAAAAAVVALHGREIRVAARSRERAQSLADRFGAGVGVAGWEEPGSPSVVVNATPLGMDGEPLPPHLLDPALGLFDMAYGNAPTPAVEASRARGIPVATGLDLLVAQAALSFEIWTGVAPVRDVMRAAAEAELSRRGLEEERQ